MKYAEDCRNRSKMKTEKKALLIFFLISFGIPAILSIFMSASFMKDQNLAVFRSVWSLLPASAVMVGTLSTYKEDVSEKKKLPKALYITFPVFTAMLILMAVWNAYRTKEGQVQLMGTVSDRIDVSDRFLSIFADKRV